MDYFESLPLWQRFGIIMATLAIVAGASYLISAGGAPEPVKRTPPDEVYNVPDPDKVLPPTKGRVGGIVVVPSEIVARGLTPGTPLPPIKVQNRSNQPANIVTDFVPVDQTLLNGLPVIRTSSASLEEGRSLVSVSPGKFRLLPGQTRTVSAQALQPRSGTSSLYGAIGLTIKDQEGDISEPQKQGVRVEFRNDIRVNAMLYASFQQASSERVQLQQVRAVQEGDEVRLFARVRGDGDFISSPTGEITVTKDGATVITKRIAPGQRVLPGAERDLSTEGSLPPLPAGDYQAEAVVSADGKTQATRWAFEVTEDGTLPAPAAKTALLVNPDQAKPGSQVQLLAQVENTGTKDFAVVGKVEVLPLGKEEVLSSAKFSIPTISVGDFGEEQISFAAPQEAGNYEAVATIETEDGSFLEQRVASFLVTAEPEPAPGVWVKFRDWLSDNPLSGVAVGILGFGVLSLLVLLGLLLNQRRRQGKKKVETKR